MVGSSNLIKQGRGATIVRITDQGVYHDSWKMRAWFQTNSSISGRSRLRDASGWERRKRSAQPFLRLGDRTQRTRRKQVKVRVWGVWKCDMPRTSISHPKPIGHTPQEFQHYFGYGSTRTISYILYQDWFIRDSNT
jgi:hypothetical protein